MSATCTKGSASTLLSTQLGGQTPVWLMQVGSSIRTHMEVPGYGGSFSSYLLTIDGGTNLPPKKW